MTPSDSQPAGTGGVPEASRNTALAVDDVKNIIAQAQMGMTDPVTIGMQIFNNLGDNVAVSGDILRQALTDSSVAVDGLLSALIAAAQSLTKLGSRVTVTNTDEIKTEINGTPIKFKPLVAFDIGTETSFPTISNIQGAAAHKVFWFDITKIQLRENQGKKIVHVVTSGGARDFSLS